MSGRACVAWSGLSAWLDKQSLVGLKKAEQQPPLANTLVESEVDDVLKLDELRSFVAKKSNKRWVWIDLCRQTRQVVAIFIGDRIYLCNSSVVPAYKRVVNAF